MAAAIATAVKEIRQPKLVPAKGLDVIATDIAPNADTALRGFVSTA